MIKLFIDSQETDLDPSTGIALTISIGQITKIESGRTGYSKLIRVPITARNRQLFGDADEIHALDAFNQAEHTARIEADGCTVLDGEPVIGKCERSSNGSGWYCINLIGASKTWVKSVSGKMFNTTPIAFETTISAQGVAQSWTSDAPVRFLPVQRDRLDTSSENLTAGVRQLTFTDYHPFINLRALVDAMLTDAGYTLSSAFMDSDYFRSLYMSGNYPEKDVTLLSGRMGFIAGRTADATAAADRFGCVYADPFTTLYSIGNIVDTADSTTLAGTLNNNSCFQTDTGQILYKPVESVAVGFEYRMAYRSDYRILSRTELTCFNRLTADDDLERIYKVTNPNTDRRSTYRSGWEYRLFVFTHTSGNSYRLTHDVNGTTVTVATFTDRTVKVSTPSGDIANPTLWIMRNGSYVRYTDDWALYDGYVAERGQIDMELTVRSMPRTVSPSSPRYFNRIIFGGAEEGMSLTLRSRSTLRTIFMPHPCEGSHVTFADIAAHPVRQITLLNALKQLFNLYFYTDTISHTVYIEPRESFYRNDPVIDWSDRIDRQHPVTIEELGSDLSQTLTLDYAAGDGYVARWDQANDDKFGAWSTTIANRSAEEGERQYLNPLFSASLNRTGVFPDAPAASLIQAGNRDDGDATELGENLNFPTKIVRYNGMKPLNEGYWGWPSYGTLYPHLAFHDSTAETPFTLCFEDRDGLTGLHTQYDKTIDLYNHGRRITLYVHLHPEEVEAIVHPNGLCRDLRARFKLTIDGETVWCRLEEISDYNPSGGQSTKCIFLKY